MNSEDYGWKPEVSQWYNDVLINKNNPTAEIWKTIQRPENIFQTASWWLARKVIQDKDNLRLGYRKQIKHLVSREETRGSFPFTQFIRELCQNALDSAKDGEDLNITLNIDEEGMFFSHDGRTFKGPIPTSPEGEMASLYAPGMTTKEGTFNSEGRFGIGFKGWMIFFQGIKHEHSDGNQKIQIGYRFEGDGYNRDEVILKGTEHPDNKSNRERNTSFRFTNPTKEFQPPTIDEIIGEWTPMIRFAHFGVSIKIKILDKEAEVTHRVNVLASTETPSLQKQDIFESFTDINYGTIDKPGMFKCNYSECDPVPFEHTPDCPTCNSNDCVEFYYIENNPHPRYRCSFDEDCVDFELSEMPDCPECEDGNDVVYNDTSPITEERIIGIRSQIKKATEIDNAITNYIELELEHYAEQKLEVNPWASVDLADWYSNKYVTLAVDLSDTTGDNPWLFSMAEITSADGWPGNKFHDSSNWIIDGPFLLSPTRKELKNDVLSNAANATLLKFILSGCVPNLANHLLQDNNLGKLSHSTPFDIMFENEARDPENNAFESITFAQEDNEETPWGKNPKSYLEVFGGFTLYCNYSGDLINARKIRRIPHSWKVDSQQSLAEWLQEKDEVMSEFFDFIPILTDKDTSEIINDGNYPLSWIIPEIEKDELYRILTESGLCEELAEDYPKVVHSEWYQVPIDSQISCLIFGQEPNDNSLVNQIKKYAIDPTLKFVDNSHELAIKYKDKTGVWNEYNEVYCLTAPPEPPDGWWFDRFMERIIRDNIEIPKDEIEEMAASINNNVDVSYFVAKAVVRHKNKAGDAFTESEEDLVIVPKKFKWVDWTILPNTMTAWKVKRQNTGSGLRLWKLVKKENHSRILCNGQIYIPTGEFEYFCTYTEDECRGVFEPEISPNSGEMPSCPDCGDDSDVIVRGASPLSCLTNKEFFIVIGEPINPKEVIDLTMSIAEKKCPEDYGLQSAVMIARPHPLPNCLRNHLMAESWTKLPSLSVTNNRDNLPDEFHYNDRGKFNQPDVYLKGIWAEPNNGPSSELEPFYSHFIGHTLNLHTKYRRRKQKNALIREIGQRELISHTEWTAMGEIHQSTKLITQINQERAVNYGRLSFSLIRINRDGSSKKYSFKKANVRTTRMRAAAFNDQHNIPYEESQILEDDGWCGFSETPELESEAWMISMADGKDIALRLFNEIEGLEFIHLSEISVPILPEDKTILKGLCMGAMKVIQSVLESDADKVKLISALAKTVEKIDSILPNDSSMFELLNDNNMNPSIEQKEGILELVENALKISNENDEMESLNYLKSSLQEVQAQTWDDVVDAINEYETDEEQWNYFQSITSLPRGPPVFSFKPQTDTFRRGPEHMSRRIADYSYITNRDAQRLFKINEKSGLEDGREEDAAGWATPSGPRNNKRLYIMDKRIENLLEYEGTDEFSIGKVDLQSVLNQTERGKQLEHIGDEKLEDLMSRQWGFAQLLIALKLAQISNVSDFEIFIPEIGERDKNHACEVFKGRQLNLGKGGWDLCTNNSENQNNLMLVTNNKEQGQKAFLLQLILKLDIDRQIVYKTSIHNDEDIISLAEHFGIKFDKFKQKIVTLRKIAGGALLNPWFHGEESEDWDLRFGKKPEWRSDKDKSIERADARKLLKEYTNAISSLLRRGEMGPARNDETQDLIHNLPNVRNEIKDELYQNIGSLLADEPIVSPPGEVSTKMGNLRRYRKLNDKRIGMLENAKLDLFIGNLLFLSRFSTHRGTMYSDPYGLKERTEQTIEYTLNQILKHKDAWGSEETILLRDVMQIGPSNYLSLRLHKYHAICIVALDQAFSSFEEDEE